MHVIAQAGLGAASRAMHTLLTLSFLLAVAVPPLFLLVWYLPETCRVVFDWLRGRDLLAESDAERELEGRLFPPEHRPRREDE